MELSGKIRHTGGGMHSCVICFGTGVSTIEIDISVFGSGASHFWVMSTSGISIAGADAPIIGAGDVPRFV